MTHGHEPPATPALPHGVGFSRVLCAVAAALYLNWYFVVRLVLPQAFNPLASRLFVVGYFAAALGLSYVSAAARRHLQVLFAVGAWLTTLHFYYLLHENHADGEWLLGAYVTIVTISACLVTRLSLLCYSLFVVVLSGVVSALDPSLAHSIFLPGVVTMVILSNLALHNRIRISEQLAESRRGVAIAQHEIRKRDDFVAIASHELRTPLTPIKLTLQTLLRANRDRATSTMTAERSAELMARALRQVDRLCRLVEEMLDVAKMSAQRFGLSAPNVSEVDLAELARGVIAGLGAGTGVATGTEGGPTIHLDAGGPVPCRCDPLRIEQVLGNLLKNAINYGEGRPITVALAARGATVTLSVEDQGIGIAPADQARVFERFERGVSDQLPSGLGVGLYVVQQIVEAHGGSLRLRSAPGKGSRFTIELPRDVLAVRSLSPADAPDAP